jgi:pimeloyl-ACP methyl ester carboxylesterase
MVDDLKELIADLNLENSILIGHSMGGKVAMHFAQKFPEKIEKLVVVDMGVKQYTRHHQEVLEAFNKVDLNGITARSQVELILSDFIESKGVRQFLLKNLDRLGDGTFGWKMNLPVLIYEYKEMLDFPSKGLFDGPTLFLKGEKSDYILPSDESIIHQYFPKAKIVSIKNAGHWVHTENPVEFISETSIFLK